jgi:O-antigen ligase
LIRALLKPERSRQVETWLIVTAVLALAFVLGLRASPLWLGLLLALAGGAMLLITPALGLPTLVLAALVVPLEIGTGTEVKLNPVTLLIPAVLAVWLLSMLRRREIRLTPSPANLPLFLFLLASLVSLLVGRATWDPMVPLQGNFLLVQLAQWAIFALSAGAFWLTANLVKEERWLWRLTVVFLLASGGLAILYTLPPAGELASRLATASLNRAPYWALLAAVAGGQLLFNRGLALGWRVFLVAVLAACAAYGFVRQQESVSNWVGLTAVLGTLVWLRFHRVRWAVVIIVVVLIALGVLIPGIYRFAGGDREWGTSGGSRLVLAQRVIEVTLRNPITGLGPAAYRLYANMKPLLYRGAYWISPQVNSHNNYVDLFAHGGVVGLALFAWFAIALAQTGLRLRQRCTTGFAMGYVNGMLAMGVGALVIMLLADWILPFVYNIGFPGFQASVLVWLFLGGLVALENVGRRDEATG